MTAKRAAVACLIAVVVAVATATVATDRESVMPAVLRTGAWLAEFPVDDLRFDAAIGLHEIRSEVDSTEFADAWRRAVEVADRDEDNPLRKFWDPAVTAPAKFTAGWTVPGPNDSRVNTNRPVAEALHCVANGWRSETTAYVAGPMRDDGGYHTTHGLWALTIARTNGCLAESEFQLVARTLVDEIRAALTAAPEPQSVLEIDLFAERLLVTVLADEDTPVLNVWVSRHVALQNEDGSWGTLAEGEDAYFQYHATLVSAWALAEYAASPKCR